ncbi:hypothetical protein ACQY0O_002477 [Thecaphora frezii]
MLYSTHIVAEPLAGPSYEALRHHPRPPQQEPLPRSGRNVLRDVQAWSIEVHRQQRLEKSRAKEEAEMSHPTHPEAGLSDSYRDWQHARGAADKTASPEQWRASPPLPRQARPDPFGQAAESDSIQADPFAMEFHVPDHEDGSLQPPSRHLSQLSSRAALRSKRTRQLLTPDQTKVLYRLLEKTRFPPTQVREAVAKQLGISPRKVQVWFQNRRQIGKKMMQAAGGIHPRPDDRLSMVHVPRPETVPNQPHAGAAPFGLPQHASTNVVVRPSDRARHATSATQYDASPSWRVGANAAPHPWRGHSGRLGYELNARSLRDEVTLLQAGEPGARWPNVVGGQSVVARSLSRSNGAGSGDPATATPVTRPHLLGSLRRTNSYDPSGSHGEPGIPPPPLASSEQRTSPMLPQQLGRLHRTVEASRRLRSQTVGGPLSSIPDGAMVQGSPAPSPASYAPQRASDANQAHNPRGRFSPYHMPWVRRSLSFESQQYADAAELRPPPPPLGCPVPSADPGPAPRLAPVRNRSSSDIVSLPYPSVVQDDRLRSRRFSSPRHSLHEETLEESDDARSYCSKSFASAIGPVGSGYRSRRSTGISSIPEGDAAERYALPTMEACKAAEATKVAGANARRRSDSSDGNFTPETNRLPPLRPEGRQRWFGKDHAGTGVGVGVGVGVNGTASPLSRTASSESGTPVPSEAASPVQQGLERRLSDLHFILDLGAGDGRDADACSTAASIDRVPRMGDDGAGDQEEADRRRRISMMDIRTITSV